MKDNLLSSLPSFLLPCFALPFKTSSIAPNVYGSLECNETNLRTLEMSAYSLEDAIFEKEEHTLWR